MKIRYTGDSAARDIPLSGGSFTVERMKWFDLVKAATDAGIRAEHAEIVARDLAGQDDWEAEPHKKKTDHEEKS